MTGKHIFGHGVGRLYDLLPEDEYPFPGVAAPAAATRPCSLANCTSVPASTSRRSAIRTTASTSTSIASRRAWAWTHPSTAMCAGWASAIRNFLAQLRAKKRGLKHIPRECHFTHWAAEPTIDYIRTADPTQPFFCMMSVFDPHNPYDQYPAEYAGALPSCHRCCRPPLATTPLMRWRRNGGSPTSALLLASRLTTSLPCATVTTLSCADRRRGGGVCWPRQSRG